MSAKFARMSNRRKKKALNKERQLQFIQLVRRALDEFDPPATPSKIKAALIKVASLHHPIPVISVTQDLNDPSQLNMKFVL